MIIYYLLLINDELKACAREGGYGKSGGSPAGAIWKNKANMPAFGRKL